MVWQDQHFPVKSCFPVEMSAPSLDVVSPAQPAASKTAASNAGTTRRINVF
jgi:hypothetical protein